MKKSVKILALILIVLFCVSSIPAYAATLRGDGDDASGPQYTNTKDFVRWLDDAGVDYRYTGIDDDNDEAVRVDEVDESGNEYTINFFFDDDEELISIRIWYVISFDQSNLYDVMEACNQLNYQYRFIKIYVDETDNTVSADMDLIVREGEPSGECAYEALLRLEILMGYAYEALAPYIS